MPWKPEYAERRRAKYRDDPAERERRKQQCRDPADNSKYMREYYLKHPEKFRRPPEQQEANNARRRERYAADAAYRDACKAVARARCPEKRRDGRLRSQFGIDNAGYDAMLALQGGGCAICGSKLGSKRGEKLAVDHCHASGAVRGILCTNCNQGLGKFRDDPERIRRAAEYIERSRLVGDLV